MAFRRWLLALAALALLLALLAWGGGALARIRSILILGGGEAVAPRTSEVFQGMGFLAQAPRAGAPDFFLPTLEGQNHTLSQHRGKVVLINFWATWCPPCIREMPSMQLLYDKFRAQGFEIVAISLDQGNPDGVREFVQKLNLSFPIVLDAANDVKQLYQVRGLPTSYLIDRQGRVAAWGMGAREWDGPKAHALVAHLLSEKG